MKWWLSINGSQKRNVITVLSRNIILITVFWKNATLTDFCLFFLLWFTVTFRVSWGPSFDLHQRLPLYSFHFPQYLFQQKHLGKHCKRWKTKTIEVTKGRNNSVRTRISQIAQTTKNTTTSSSETLRTHGEAKHSHNKPIAWHIVFALGGDA